MKLITDKLISIWSPSDIFVYSHPHSTRTELCSPNVCKSSIVVYKKKCW